MNNRVFLFLPAALTLAACSSLPRAEKITVPPYLSVKIDHHETLGEFLIITPSFKILLPETSRERTAYLETQVADFDRMKLYKDNGYGLDKTVPTNDKKTVAEQLARYGKVTKVIPETLTISAKFVSGKTPRIVLTASPSILDGDGALHFSLQEQAVPGGRGNPGAGGKAMVLQEAEEAPAAAPLTPEKKAASIRTYLQKKYGKTLTLKRSGAVLSATGQPVIGIDAELTFFFENARITFNGTVKNLGQQKIWATYYLPQLTYRKGRDWYIFTARQFSKSLSKKEMRLYLISPGTEKKFQFTTDPELQVLVYDAALKRIAARNAFASKDEDDLLKFEILEKYLGGSPDVRLEVFPNRLICVDCGVKLY